MGRRCQHEYQTCICGPTGMYEHTDETIYVLFSQVKKNKIENEDRFFGS